MSPTPPLYGFNAKAKYFYTTDITRIFGAGILNPCRDCQGKKRETRSVSALDPPEADPLFFAFSALVTALLKPFTRNLF